MIVTKRRIGSLARLNRDRHVDQILVSDINVILAIAETNPLPFTAARPQIIDAEAGIEVAVTFQRLVIGCDRADIAGRRRRNFFQADEFHFRQLLQGLSDLKEFSDRRSTRLNAHDTA